SFPVIHLKISRVADFYYHYFNHWKPRGETGYLDIDLHEEPDREWKRVEKILNAQLEHHGFCFLTGKASSEKLPFLLERDYDGIPDDDPRWDDDGFEPLYVPTTMHEALFSY
ncbi:MAG: hypothetical protein AAGC68_06715, partial [Verrucomicrobiota bacterium]